MSPDWIDRASPGHELIHIYSDANEEPCYVYEARTISRAQEKLDELVHLDSRCTESHLSADLLICLNV